MSNNKETVVSDPPPERVLAWAVSARAALQAPRLVEHLLAGSGVEGAADQLLHTQDRTGLPVDLGDQARRDLDTAHACGARLITPDHREWCDRLGVLRPRGDAPRCALVALWARGPLRLDRAGESAVAVIGARAATSYGVHVTTDMVQTLAATHTILSGGAYGIDAAAHRAALAASASTAAVVATGIDRIYPAGNETLLEQIAEQGLLLSEYPPGQPAAPQQFLARNRIVTAIARAVLVVEAAAKSGTMSAAEWAMQLGRPVFAVPGPITSRLSDGPHTLIRTLRARIVTDPAQITVSLDTSPF